MGWPGCLPGATSPRRREVDALTQLREADISANDAAISTTSSATQPEPDLHGQTVLVIGGSSGIGLETARLARAKGADLILTARDPDRLHRVGLELKASIAAFDATDFDRLGRFFDALATPIDTARAAVDLRALLLDECRVA